MSIRHTIRGWFDRRCRVPGCQRRTPLFTNICNYHAGPNNENA